MDGGTPVIGRSGLDALYRAEHRDVLGLAFVLTGDRSIAEELAQEAFLEAHRAWERIGAYDDPAAWVRRVVANRAVSRFRRRASERRALARVGAEPQPVVELEPADAEFWEAVRRLPARQAQAVTLHYLEDRSVADIAEVLGIGPATVKVHLHRGRRALAEALDCPLPEEDDDAR